jgi:hypothetical protein
MFLKICKFLNIERICKTSNGKFLRSQFDNSNYENFIFHRFVLLKI